MKINLDTIADWMAERGDFSYANKIYRLRQQWPADDFNLQTLIREVQQEAMDRYNDWVSDPLD